MKEIQMRRVIYALIVSLIAVVPAVRSQTSTTANAAASSAPGTPSATQPKPKIGDCACESQVLPEVLAIVNGVTVTRKDVAKATDDAVSRLQRQVIDARSRELDLMINSRLLALEAKKRGVSTTKLLEQEVVAKVARPTTAEAQAFYNQNRARINEDFKDVVDDIISYLLDLRQRAEAKKFADGLRAASETKVLVTEVTPASNEADRARVLATINGEPITLGELENSLLPMIFDVQEQVYRLRKEELDRSINDTLLAQEAQRRKITIHTLLDAEVRPNGVTDEQVRTFYEENKDRVSGDLVQTKDAIRRYLEQIEVRRSERAFLDRLRASASLQVFLITPESPVFSISTIDQPSLGNANAAVTIVVFTDYQCPSCAAIHPELERLVKDYGDKVRLVTRDFPLTQHAEAFKAAEAAEAAREQGKYWEYIHVLMQNQSALGMESLKTYACEVGLDPERFDTAIDSGKFAELVQRDIEDGIKLGLKGTPSLFINGRLVAATTYEDLKTRIEALLKSSIPAGR
jgi:predicted DsbA family dithiol-disulfide isomerase/CRISPR/Cas system CSM-associated protein Csm2 small subunit